MLLVLKWGAGKKESKAILEKIYKDKVVTGFSAKKYNDILNLNEDPLKIQKRLRSEWEKNFS